MTTTLTRTTAKNEPTAKTAMRQSVTDVLLVLEDFTSLLMTETEALEKSDFKTVDTLQSDKKRLAKQYHENITQMMSHRETLAALEVPLRDKLINARTKFTVILDENLRTLENTRHSAQRLIDRILETARNNVVDEKQTGYSQKGHTQAYKTATMSLSVDQNL